jgi:hypothetical protein
MTIKKVTEKYRKYAVKNLPKDAIYSQQDVNDNKIYYSESKKAYYVIIESIEKECANCMHGGACGDYDETKSYQACWER